MTKALSLILLCATTVRVGIAQDGARENAEAASQARRDGLITGRVVNDAGRPVAWDAAERAKLRREALTAENEIELKRNRWGTLKN